MWDSFWSMVCVGYGFIFSLFWCSGTRLLLLDQLLRLLPWSACYMVDLNLFNGWVLALRMLNMTFPCHFEMTIAFYQGLKLLPRCINLHNVWYYYSTLYMCLFVLAHQYLSLLVNKYVVKNTT